MTSKTVALAALVLVFFSGLAGAQAPSTWPDRDGFIPDISIAEIMEAMVMPAAQILWDAVGVDVTEQGQIEKKPETDEQHGRDLGNRRRDRRSLRRLPPAVLVSRAAMTASGARPPARRSD
jgi:hypothetical protein